MMCVKTVFYSILINGVPKSYIHPTRGLRQGDPISPYLFLLCAEGLSAMIKREMSMGRLSGVQFCPGLLRFLTCYLPTIALFSVELPRKKATEWSRF